MPSFNKVIVMGNLTRDPEVRQVGVNAVKVCRFALALNEHSWEKDGQKHQKLKIRAMTVKFMPLPAPNQSRLTGEPIAQGGQAAGTPPAMPPSGDIDGYDEEQPF